MAYRTSDMQRNIKYVRDGRFVIIHYTYMYFDNTVALSVTFL